MGEVRIHTVMGKTQVSLWCKSHGGKAHCLWRGQKWRMGLEPGDVLFTLAEAAAAMAEAFDRGEMVELTDDCL